MSGEVSKSSAATVPGLDPVLEVARALADESRLRILASLGHGELCLCQLVDLLDLAPSTVSRHLQQLRGAGLVERRKEGRWHWFRLAGDGAAPAAAAALDWVRASLAGDPSADEVERRVCCVRQKDLADLAACYG